MTARKGVAYSTVYLWTCPDCGTTWQIRSRPRAGHDLACAPTAEQRAVTAQRAPIASTKACGTVHTSAGKRSGVAPNVSI